MRPLPARSFVFAEFRRGAAADVSREMAPLLKAYQEEVDRVTARCAALLLSAWFLCSVAACISMSGLSCEVSLSDGAMVQAASPRYPC